VCTTLPSLLFEKWATKFLPGLSLDFNTPVLRLLSTLDYRQESLHPALVSVFCFVFSRNEGVVMSEPQIKNKL
jgi:hypothetical protein